MSAVIKHQFVTVKNVNIHYAEASRGNPKETQPQTIIFLHGFPEFWGTWHAQLEFFANEYRVIAPDLPGYNLSDKPSEASFYAVPNLIQFMAEFIQIVAPNEKVVLVAHDWGGAIAWPLAAFSPNLIEKLVILNAAHPSTFTREMIDNPTQRHKSEYIHELISPDAVQHLSDNQCQYLQDKIFAGMQAHTLSQAQRDVYQQVWTQPGAINGMLQYYRAMPQLAPSENKRGEDAGPVVVPSQMKIPNIRITCPTLVLWGEKDQAFVVENLNGLEDYVPELTVKRFPNASHWLQHECGDEVNLQIAGFIQ